MHLSQFIEDTTPRANFNVNCGLGEIMCQCRLLDFSEYTTLMWDFDSDGGCACVRVGDIWKLSETSAQFFSSFVNL